jgi:hypothetical protein
VRIVAVLDTMLKKLTLPRALEAQRHCDAKPLDKVERTPRADLRGPAISGKIVPGKRIAVGIASRGLCKRLVRERT